VPTFVQIPSLSEETLHHMEWLLTRTTDARMNNDWRDNGQMEKPKTQCFPSMIVGVGITIYEFILWC